MNIWALWPIFPYSAIIFRQLWELGGQILWFYERIEFGWWEDIAAAWPSRQHPSNPAAMRLRPGGPLRAPPSARALSAFGDPRSAEHLRGIECADSLTIDAHKWFAVPMGAGMFLCRDQDLLGETFRVAASYMPESTKAARRTEPWFTPSPDHAPSNANGSNASNRTMRSRLPQPHLPASSAHLYRARWRTAPIAFRSSHLRNRP